MCVLIIFDISIIDHKVLSQSTLHVITDVYRIIREYEIKYLLYILFFRASLHSTWIHYLHWKKIYDQGALSELSVRFIDEISPPVSVMVISCFAESGPRLKHAASSYARSHNAAIFSNATLGRSREKSFDR